MKHTFHIVNLPHTQVTAEYTHCAYTQKVRKFAKMMHDRGHEVIVYGSEDIDVEVTEHVTVITKKEQQRYFGDNDHTKKFFNITWGPNDKHWLHMNNNAIGEIKKRIQPGDFICLIAGICQKQIADAFPENFSVEYGIGYTGTFSQFRVFESYAHLHYVHGDQRDDNGNFYDTVIPNYYDISEFPLRTKKPREPYFLFVGRLINRKGFHIAQEVCEKLGKKLILAGQGDFEGYGEHVGVIGVEERGRLMSNAEAVFVPTTYLEPFGGVHAEALLCGTPVITTNFGVFTETVQNDFNGQRCDVYRDFVNAVKWAENVSQEQREAIQVAAQARFGLDEVAKQYEDYFNRVADLKKLGWYEL